MTIMILAEMADSVSRAAVDVQEKPRFVRRRSPSKIRSSDVICLGLA